MKLIRLNNSNPNKFLCDVTLYIDELSGIGLHRAKTYGHYFQIESKFLNENTIPIHYLGTMIGGIYLDNENRITDIELVLNPCNRYPKDINDTLNLKFRGKTIEFNREGYL